MYESRPKDKLIDWFMKRDPPMKITADFEFMNRPLESANENDSMKKLFVNKPVAIGYNMLKSSGYDNIILEKDWHIRYCGEECVEWFINEMLEIGTYMKKFFENDMKLKPDTLNAYVAKKCWLCEKENNTEDQTENPIAKDPCHLTFRIRGLGHDNFNMTT